MCSCHAAPRGSLSRPSPGTRYSLCSASRAVAALRSSTANVHIQALKRSARVLSNENRTGASEQFPAHVLLGGKSKETLLLDPDFVNSREGFLLFHFSVLFLLNSMKMCNSVKHINKCLIYNVSRLRDGGWSHAAVPWEGATGVGLVTPGSPRLGLAGLPSEAQASVLPEIVQVPCRSP